MGEQPAELPEVEAPTEGAPEAETPDTGADVAIASGKGSGGAADKAAELVNDDPDFEFEIEAKDDKGASTKTVSKLKMSEAKQRLAKLAELEGRTVGTQKQLEKYYNEQIKPLQQRIAEARQSPAKLATLARELGVDFDAAAIEYAKQQVELGNLTPEQREARELKARLEKYELAEKTQKEQAQQAQQQAQIAQASEKLQVSIVEAAVKVGLPKDPSVMMIMTGFMRNQLDANETPDPVAAAQYASKVFQGGLAQSIKSMSYEQIEKNFPELLTKIREGDIKKVRGTVPKPSSAPKPKASADRPTKTFLSPEEWQASLEKGE